MIQKNINQFKLKVLLSYLINEFIDISLKVTLQIRL